MRRERCAVAFRNAHMPSVDRAAQIRRFWNKLHRALREVGLDSERAREAAQATQADWNRLRNAWGAEFEANLARVREEECHLSLRMVGGSNVGYARSASRWWVPIQAALNEMGLADAQVFRTVAPALAASAPASRVRERSGGPWSASATSPPARAAPDIATSA